MIMLGYKKKDRDLFVLSFFFLLRRGIVYRCCLRKRNRSLARFDLEECSYSRQALFYAANYSAQQ